MTIMATLWQFMSRSDMTRDNMSQVLGAWGLGLGAWGFFSLLLIPDPLVIKDSKFPMDLGSARRSRISDPRSN